MQHHTIVQTNTIPHDTIPYQGVVEEDQQHHQHLGIEEEDDERKSNRLNFNQHVVIFLSQACMVCLVCDFACGNVLWFGL